MAKYQVTELDKVVEQVKGFSEWTNEDQLEHQLRFQEESHKKALERKSIENVELYTNNVLLKRKVKDLESQLEEYRKLQSEVHRDIERVWMYDSSYGLDDNQTIDRDTCIERVFYKIANQWID
jgi:hypothetical protein